MVGCLPNEVGRGKNVRLGQRKEWLNPWQSPISHPFFGSSMVQQACWWVLHG